MKSVDIIHLIKVNASVFSVYIVAIFAFNLTPCAPYDMRLKKRSSTDQRVSGSIPSPCIQHVVGDLGQDTDPQTALEGMVKSIAVYVGCFENAN